MARISTIAVFCGSRTGRNPRYAEAAAKLGRLAAERGIRIVFGGGAVGMMGRLAAGVRAAGGDAVGVIPKFLKQAEHAAPAGDNLVVVGSMHERKARIFEMADAFVALPGGLGTLDETVEVMTWRQLGLHDKPIVIVDEDGYWARWLQLTEAMIEADFAGAAVRKLAVVVSDVDGVFPALAAAPEPANRGRPGRL